MNAKVSTETTSPSATRTFSAAWRALAAMSNEPAMHTAAAANLKDLEMRVILTSPLVLRGRLKRARLKDTSQLSIGSASGGSLAATACPLATGGGRNMVVSC